MTLEMLSTWLRCPLCATPLSAVPPLILRCENGHSYDANRRGFVNLLGPKTAFTGDTTAMLDAREAFLDAAHYEPIRAALAAAIGTHAVPDAGTGALRVIDAGCGTGYYLEGVLSTLGGSARALAFDVSPAAVQRAVRRTAGQADGVVADTWSPLPLRDSSADALFAVFAPRNLPEFHRVLAPGGALVIVVPTAAHLQELRGEGNEGQALEVPPEKAERLVDATAALFAHRETTRVEYRIVLGDEEAQALVRMGPAGHHRTAEQLSAITGGSTTVSVDVVSITRIN